MSKLSLVFRTAGVMPLLALLACSPASTPPVEPTEPTAETAPSEDQAAGQLTIRANGEDFVRQGFVTKDDWQVTFDHVYVTLAEVTAYQSDPPFDAEAGGKPQATETISIDEPTTLDLAEGGDRKSVA